jgi:parvulin-like peptidyl-prolyl isomerase
VTAKHKTRCFRNAFYVLSLAAALVWGRNVSAAEALFDDPIVAKGKSIQIRESDLQEAYMSHKAAAAALGQPTPAALANQLKKQLLDKMVVTKLLLTRATAQDLEEGKKIATRLTAETKQKAGSEGSYRRRLLAVGSSPEKYEAELAEQAIVQAVIDRELKRKQPIPEDQIKKFYDDHPDLYQEPERARVSQILFATRKIPTGEPLPLEQRLAKKAAAEKAAARARDGEDFTKLVQELSDDTESKPKNGEISFTRGSGSVPQQFEAASLSLKAGQISDPVLTVFGYHLIKLLEKTPPGRAPLDKVHDLIVEHLQRVAVQSKLPDYLANLKKEAGVEVQLPE